MELVFSDGGKKEAGFSGNAGDCVVRAIAIVSGKPYIEVYNALNALSKFERRGKRKRGISNSRTGVYRTTYERYLKSLGFTWVPTMHIGQGCKTHLKASELPSGRIICTLSKHLTAVIDGIIYDTHDCSRNETRCVYGYYIKQG